MTNKRIFSLSFPTIIVFILLVSSIPLQPKLFSFNLENGLKIDIFQQKNDDFIYAELIIFYHHLPQNPAIATITYLNLFNKPLNKTEFFLDSILTNLGNHYSIEHYPHYLHIKLLFLPRKLPVFIRFIKALYSYKPFLNENQPTPPQTQKELFINSRLQKSKSSFWDFYHFNSEKHLLAIHFAYHAFFRENNSLINPFDASLIKQVNLRDISEFYQLNYNPKNSCLIIKGDLNPYSTFGLIKKETFHIEVNQEEFNKKKYLQTAPSIHNHHEKIIIHINAPLSQFNSAMYWFEIIPKPDQANFLAFQLFNTIIFEEFVGRIHRNKSKSGIRKLEIESDTVFHPRMSLLYNTFNLSSINYPDLSHLIYTELKNIQNKNPLNRKEYLEAKNLFFGKKKINSLDIRHQISDNIVSFICQCSFSNEKSFSTDNVNLNLLETICKSNENSFITKNSKMIIFITDEDYKNSPAVPDGKLIKLFQ
jgi:hypothetical protein